jgi:hypothetical protein
MVASFTNYYPSGATGGRVYIVNSETATGASVVYTSAAPLWTANIPDPEPKLSKDQLRRIELREWSWAAIARRERAMLRERPIAPREPPRPHRPRARVTSPANAYRVTA